MLCVAILTAHQRAAFGGDLSFWVETAQGKAFVGPLKKLTPDWGIELDIPVDGAISGKNVLSLRRGQTLLPMPTTSAQLVLSTGDRIPIDPAEGVQFVKNQFHVHPVAPLRPAQGDTLQVSSAMVAALWFAPPESVSRPEPFLRQLLSKPHDADTVLLQNGDRVEGIVLELDNKAGCKLKAEKKPLHVPFDRIAAVVFNSLFLVRPPATQPYAHLVLADGCRLSLSAAELDSAKKMLTGKTLFQAVVQFPVKDLIALDIYQGAAVYLSDLKPKTYAHTPFFGVTWPLSVDAGGTGAALRLGGDVFDKGLGMHTGSQVSYELGGKYEWFEALVGLEDGNKGSARISVLVDGKIQPLSGNGELSGLDAPLALRVAVQQAKLLTLRADFAGLGDVQGHIGWAKARLIKK